MQNNNLQTTVSATNLHKELDIVKRQVANLQRTVSHQDQAIEKLLETTRKQEQLIANLTWTKSQGAIVKVDLY